MQVAFWSWMPSQQLLCIVLPTPTRLMTPVEGTARDSFLDALTGFSSHQVFPGPAAQGSLLISRLGLGGHHTVPMHLSHKTGEDSSGRSVLMGTEA